ncbi:MAG TPA: ferrochelatase [Acidimicrobiia bacterium]|nr:ferrochelatase [Acidimicrobiia bacterium]
MTPNVASLLGGEKGIFRFKEATCCRWGPSVLSLDVNQPIGVLLLQLGTPDSTSTSDVRRYLREFLSDPRVIDIPGPARWLLLNAVILPFRPRKSAEAYEKVWTEAGSPLLIHTADLRDRLADELGPGYRVAFGMRYRLPPISDALVELAEAGCERIVIVPLFPQYASASTGSAVEAALDLIGRATNVLSISTVGAFYDDGGYLRSVATVARPALEQFAPDHVLFSYHGLPETQIRRSESKPGWCLADPSCCASITAANRFCYRAQAHATTRGAVAELGLSEGSYSTSFQSRLKGQKWIEPYTDFELPRLYQSGVRRLAVLTPSFVADCLETIEEIGIRGRKQWEDLGGEDFLLVPCVNTDPTWVTAAADLIRRAG